MAGFVFIYFHAYAAAHRELNTRFNKPFKFCDVRNSLAIWKLTSTSRFILVYTFYIALAHAHMQPYFNVI